MNCSTAAARHLASSGVDVYTAIGGEAALGVGYQQHVVLTWGYLYVRQWPGASLCAADHVVLITCEVRHQRTAWEKCQNGGCWAGLAVLSMNKQWDA